MKGLFIIAIMFASASVKAQVLKVLKDTVELPAGINFIKVDGKIYEIKRETSLQEVPKYSTITFGSRGIDTIFPNGSVRFGSGWLTPTSKDTRLMPLNSRSVLVED